MLLIDDQVTNEIVTVTQNVNNVSTKQVSFTYRNNCVNKVRFNGPDYSHSLLLRPVLIHLEKQVL